MATENSNTSGINTLNKNAFSTLLVMVKFL